MRREQTDEPTQNQISRRELLIRGLQIGMALTANAALLAACSIRDDQVDEPALTSAQASQPAATHSSTAPPTLTAVEPTATRTPQPTETPFVRNPERHFQVASWIPITTINPHVTNGHRSWLVAQLVLEPLFNFDINSEPVLHLASNWPTFENGLLDPNGRWVIWKLRQNVRWHDGKPFSADDVITTWRFITDPSEAARGSRATRSQYELVEDIKRINDFTVKVHFSRTNPCWIDVFRGSNGVILPAHIFGPLIGSFSQDSDSENLLTIGTGPWRATEFNPTYSRIRFERFDDYWDNGKPFFDTVEYQFLTGDPFVNASRVLETGDADYAPLIEQTDLASLAQMAASTANGRLIKLPHLAVETLFINFSDPNAEPEDQRSEPTTQHPLFADRRVRQAIDLIIPRAELVANAYGPLRSSPGTHLLSAPEAFRGTAFSSEINSERAGMLLKEAGVTGGSLVIQTTRDSARELVQEIIAKSLEQLGFSVQLKNIDAGVFFSTDAENPDTYSHFSADLQFYSPGTPTPYPLEWTRRFRSDEIASSDNKWSGMNISRYSNTEFDRLHDLAQTEMDETRQIELWTQMMTILTDDVAAIPLVQRNSLSAVSSNIQTGNPSPWAANPAWDLKNWKRIT